MSCEHVLLKEKKAPAFDLPVMSLSVRTTAVVS